MSKHKNKRRRRNARAAAHARRQVPQEEPQPVVSIGRAVRASLNRDQHAVVTHADGPPFSTGGLGADKAATAWPGPVERGTELLRGLTLDQKEAVQHGPGVLLVVAGPGAGKTLALIYRTAYLLATGAAQPWQILAVTFSVRAAGELKLRLAELLGEQTASQISVATFHSVCARLLRDHGEVFGRGRDWTVYDQVETRQVVENVLSDQGRRKIQGAVALFGKPAVDEVLHEISLAKNHLLTPTIYEEQAAHPASPVIAAVWRAVEDELERSNAMDFDDLLVGGVRLLAEHPEYLEFYRRRWPVVLVDEYQDTCPAQARLVTLLVPPNGSLCAIGDDDQVLYSWRGADAEGLNRLAERYPDHTQIVLGRNFRSRAEILTAAANSIRHNKNRVPKALVAMRGPGGEVRQASFRTDEDEAAWVASTVRQTLAAGTDPGEILLLARTEYATKKAERALARAGIPHRVLGSLGLYERSEVRDALSYMTLLSNPADAQAFRRAVAAPKRGIGEQTAGHLIEYARKEHNGDLIAASLGAGAVTAIGSKKARENIERFGQGLQHARNELQQGRSLGHVAITSMMLTGGLVGYFQHLRETSESGATRRDAERVLEDLRSLCRAVGAYEQREQRPTLGGFLEEARGLHAQELAPGEKDRRITVSTIHKAKGTESATVILAGCEERLLPFWRSLTTPSALQEERRLFYVACTRAKDRLLITHTAVRGGRPTGGPSRFLAEAGLIRERHPPAPAA